MQTLWVAKLDWTDVCVSKLPGRHEILCRPGLEVEPDYAEEHGGWRYYVYIKIRGLRYLAVLRETGEDAYLLLSAYEIAEH